MKVKHPIFILLFAWSILEACQNQPSSQQDLPPTVTPSVKKNRKTTTDKIYPVIGTTWVTDRDGVFVRTDSSLSAATTKYHHYGETIDYSYISDQWLGITIKRGWTGKDPWGYKISKVIEELTFLPRIATGELKTIELIPTDLNKILAQTKLKEKTIQFTPPQPLKEFLSLDLAFKVEYLSQKSRQIRALIKDSTGMTQKGKILTLQLESRQKTFVSTPEKEEHKTVYEYVGQLPTLNKYVLRMVYWESLQYSLIDKTSGAEVARLAEYPHLSPDGKYILVVDDDVFKEYPEIELYAVNGAVVEPIVNLVFANWIPAEEVENAFWGQDGYFYISVIPRNYHHVYDDKEDVTTQYMRIKIL